MKGVGVVVVFEGFEVELATGEEEAVFLWAGYIRGDDVFDILVEEHVGVDLVPDLPRECEERSGTGHC